MAEALTTLNGVKHDLNIANTALHQAEHHTWGRAVIAVLDQIAAGTDIRLQVVDAQDAPLAPLAAWLQAGPAPVDDDPAAYLQPKPVTGAEQRPNRRRRHVFRRATHMARGASRAGRATGGIQSA